MESDFELMENLAAAIIETSIDLYEKPHDAFEEYAQTLQIHFFANTDEFQQRFRHGYELLLAPSSPPTL